MYISSVQIYRQIQEYFHTHNTPLEIIGLPHSLKTSHYQTRLDHTLHITHRLWFMGFMYIILAILPMCIESRILEYSFILSHADQFMGLVQFFTLFTFSSAFRRTLRMQLSWPKKLLSTIAILHMIHFKNKIQIILDGAFMNNHLWMTTYVS